MAGTRAVALALPLALGGCLGTPVLAGIAAAGSVATAAHAFLVVGEDVAGIIASTAVACQGLPAARAAEAARVRAGALSPAAVASPWYAALCGDLAPTNRSLDAGSAAWVAAGLARMGR